MQRCTYLIAGSLLSASICFSAQQTAPGQALYIEHCAACHGQNGDGNGPAAVWLYPKPRNFSSGLFKIQSTPAGALPTDEDLLRSITKGLPGSSMPSFTYLTEQERLDLVSYVKQLTAYTDGAGKRVNRFEEASAAPAAAVAVPPEPADTVEQLALGKEIYTKMQCANCHGETGAGDGPQVATLKDFSGLPARPRDFNTGAFRGGSTGQDVYLRIHNGLSGTPMVPYGPDVMSTTQRWALVHYVMSLRRTDVAVNDILHPEDGIIHAQKVSKLPSDPLDKAWESHDPTRVPLNPLWPEPSPIYAVAVTALHDGTTLSVLCQWRDEVPNGAPIRVQDFQDAFAIQFALAEKPPFLGMGDKEHPVNMWQWKAGWQAEAEGKPTDMRQAYNSMHVDFQFAHSSSTANEAGNVLSLPHTTPVEDANAQGFGTMTSQPVPQQNVKGRGVWHDGFWSVVFTRELKSGDKNDVRFAREQNVPVAFAAWNGEQRDRNGRKVISNWFSLRID